MIYTGIIDNLGLESFAKKAGNRFPYKMRAYLNVESRNAEAYEIELTEDEASQIEAMIKLKNWEKIGKFVKSFPNYKSIM